MPRPESPHGKSKEHARIWIERTFEDAASSQLNKAERKAISSKWYASADALYLCDHYSCTRIWEPAVGLIIWDALQYQKKLGPKRTVSVLVPLP